MLLKIILNLNSFKDMGDIIRDKTNSYLSSINFKNTRENMRDIMGNRPEDYLNPFSFLNGNGSFSQKKHSKYATFDRFGVDTTYVKNRTLEVKQSISDKVYKTPFNKSVELKSVCINNSVCEEYSSNFETYNLGYADTSRGRRFNSLSSWEVLKGSGDSLNNPNTNRLPLTRSSMGYSQNHRNFIDRYANLKASDG